MATESGFLGKGGRGEKVCRGQAIIKEKLSVEIRSAYPRRRCSDLAHAYRDA